MKEGRSANPIDKWRKQQKTKEKAKNKDDRGRIKELELKHKDPSKLIREIQKLQVMEFEGRLDSNGRLKKHNLMQKFNKLKTLRQASGLPNIEMPRLDYEGLMNQAKKEAKAIKRGEVVEDDLVEYEEDELPVVPLGIPPPNELIAYLIINSKFPTESFNIEPEPRIYIPSASFHPDMDDKLARKMEAKAQMYQNAHAQQEEAHLVPEYDDDDDNEQEATSAVVSAEPVLLQSQKQLTHMIPHSVMKKKK